MPGWLPFNFKGWTAPLILNMATHRHTTESVLRVYGYLTIAFERPWIQKPQRVFFQKQKFNGLKTLYVVWKRISVFENRTILVLFKKWCTFTTKPYFLVLCGFCTWRHKGDHLFKDVRYSKGQKMGNFSNDKSNYHKNSCSITLL